MSKSKNWYKLIIAVILIAVTTIAIISLSFAWYRSSMGAKTVAAYGSNAYRFYYYNPADSTTRYIEIRSVEVESLDEMGNPYMRREVRLVAETSRGMTYRYDNTNAAYYASISGRNYHISPVSTTPTDGFVAREYADTYNNIIGPRATISLFYVDKLTGEIDLHPVSEPKAGDNYAIGVLNGESVTYLLATPDNELSGSDTQWTTIMIELIHQGVSLTASSAVTDASISFVPKEDIPNYMGQTGINFGLDYPYYMEYYPVTINIQLADTALYASQAMYMRLILIEGDTTIERERDGIIPLTERQMYDNFSFQMEELIDRGGGDYATTGNKYMLDHGYFRLIEKAEDNENPLYSLLRVTENCTTFYRMHLFFQGEYARELLEASRETTGSIGMEYAFDFNDPTYMFAVFHLAFRFSIEPCTLLDYIGAPYIGEEYDELPSHHTYIPAIEGDYTQHTTGASYYDPDGNEFAFPVPELSIGSDDAPNTDYYFKDWVYLYYEESDGGEPTPAYTIYRNELGEDYTIFKKDPLFYKENNRNFLFHALWGESDTFTTHVTIPATGDTPLQTIETEFGLRPQSVHYRSGYTPLDAGTVSYDRYNHRLEVQNPTAGGYHYSYLDDPFSPDLHFLGWSTQEEGIKSGGAGIQYPAFNEEGKLASGTTDIYAVFSSYVLTLEFHSFEILAGDIKGIQGTLRDYGGHTYGGDTYSIKCVVDAAEIYDLLSDFYIAGATHSVIGNDYEFLRWMWRDGDDYRPIESEVGLPSLSEGETIALYPMFRRSTYTLYLDLYQPATLVGAAPRATMTITVPSTTMLGYQLSFAHGNGTDWTEVTQPTTKVNDDNQLFAISGIPDGADILAWLQIAFSTMQVDGTGTPSLLGFWTKTNDEFTAMGPNRNWKDSVSSQIVSDTSSGYVIMYSYYDESADKTYTQLMRNDGSVPVRVEGFNIIKLSAVCTSH